MDSTLVKVQNPWWGSPEAISEDSYLKALQGQAYYFVHPIIQQLEFKTGNFHILRGPRQVGKTTLIKELIALLIQNRGADAGRIFYLSCESLDSFHELQDVLAKWLMDHQSKTTHVFLDEISFVPEWQRAILWLYNAGLLKDSFLLVTGSNARDLKESSERFPGRRGGGRDLSLHPLTVADYKTLRCFQNFSDEELINIYFKVGGFPHAIRDFVTLGAVTDETYRTYKNWIVGDAGRYRLSEEILKHILFRISETFGTRITWPVLIEHTTVKSHETALEYIEHLKDAFLCHIHYCFDPDIKGPAPAKARKIYFIDPLLYYLGFAWQNNITNIFRWVDEKLSSAKFKGHLLESIHVVGATHSHSSVYYWYSTKQKKEVDLVLFENGQLQLFDVKWGKEKSYTALNQKVEILGLGDLMAGKA